MNVEIFTLCDAATNQFGKLNILGSFDSIFLKKVPVVYPQCSIAVRIRFDAIEEGEHNISVNFVNMDGKHVIPPLNKKAVLKFAQGQRTRVANIVLNIQGLKIESYGEYSVDLAVDKRQLASIPLYIQESTPQKLKKSDAADA